MSHLTAVSETLYVPLLGRIYASKHHPGILYDKAALVIEDKLPKDIKEMPGQNEYTLLASAVRSKNTDYYIRAFLSEHPDGVIVNIGCGLETSFCRNDNGKALWFELDLPEVLERRSVYIPEGERDHYLPYSMFDYTWMNAVKGAQRPVMIIASGLFFYFSERQIVDFIRHLTQFDSVRLVFDAASPAGIKIARRYMEKMDRKDAQMFFSVGSAKAFAAKISAGITVIEDRKYYSLTNLNPKMEFDTKFRILFSDMFKMMKMIYLKIK